MQVPAIVLIHRGMPSNIGTITQFSVRQSTGIPPTVVQGMAQDRLDTRLTISCLDKGY